MKISLRKQVQMGLLFISAFLISTITADVPKTHLHLDDTYMLDYEVKGDDTNGTISFNITATGVTGWVGIGINEDKVMLGADLFIGGELNGKAYGKSYKGTTNHNFTLDTNSKWTVPITSEKDGNTNMYVERPLKGWTESLTIKKEPMYLIWSYHNDSDNTDTLEHHSKRDVCKVNLLAGEKACASDDNNNGATLLSVGAGTLLMSLVATLLKY